MKKILFQFLILMFLTLFISSFNAKTRDDHNYNGTGQVLDLQNQLKAIGSDEIRSVVFISIEKIITQKYYDPFDFFFNFNNPFGKNGNEKPQVRKFKQSSVGSGVIYEKRGNDYFILTNNHVVEGADTIEITIDQSKIYKGKVLGTDPQVDIAVVKITTADNLRVVRLGDSSKVDVGDFAIAIGNPFGLSGTMTFGIISAVGRNNIQSGNVNLTDFIQTDAAINPGNSGGPLLNINGEVVGINSMIYSQSGGNVGIGFAIPISIAKKVADQIIRGGKIEHGYLGINFRSLNEKDMAKLGLNNTNNGLLILNVIKDSPSDRGGLKTGDIIIELDGKQVSNGNEFAVIIGNTNPGSRVSFKILRNNKTFTKEITIGNRNEQSFSEKSKTSTLDNYGMELSDLNASLRNKYNINPDINGVIVTLVSSDGIAGSNGIEAGDLIYKINSMDVKNIGDLKSALDNDNETNYFFIYRSGSNYIVNM